MRKTLVAASMLALMSANAAFAEGCDNPVTITWSTIAGFYSDAMAGFVKSFEDANCAKVTVVNIDNSQLYNKQVI